MNKIKMLLWVVTALLVSVFRLQAAESADFSGKYYLKGVTNVGSELLLRSDGSYDWMLAEGNRDYVSEGRWSQQGTAIVLTAAQPSASGPLFQLDPKKQTSPWNFAAEQALQDREYTQQRQKVLKICPFLDSNEYASSPRMIGEPEPSKAEREKQADEALRKLHKATKVVEKAAAEAMQTNTPIALQKAVDAMDQFQAAWLAAKETSWDAGRKGIKRPVLDLPLVCRLPQKPHVSEDKPASWSKNGTGVVVHDSVAGFPVNHLTAAFSYRDGTTQAGVAAGDGVYIVPLSGHGNPASLTLSAEQGQAEQVALPDVLLPGILYRVTVNTARLAQPLFRELRLEIDGAELVWHAIGGRYQR